jgi:hypothetical protein
MAKDLVTGRGGGKPASESDSDSDLELELGDLILVFLASMRAYMSPSSSAVFPPSFARVEIPKPPIAKPGILKPRGFFGSGGGNPMSESDDSIL